MDAALVLHAEHGMNASTFAARVTAATLADLHAAVTSALAALKGPLHGGANEDVMRPADGMRRPAAGRAESRGGCSSPARRSGLRPPRLRTFDPRATFLRKMSKQLGEVAGNTKWYEMR
jgi:citrate synthase